MKKRMTMKRRRASKYSTGIAQGLLLIKERFVVEAIKSHLVNDVSQGLIKHS
jgi:hypothetical protein